MNVLSFKHTKENIKRELLLILKMQVGDTTSISTLTEASDSTMYVLAAFAQNDRSSLDVEWTVLNPYTGQWLKKGITENKIYMNQNNCYELKDVTSAKYCRCNTSKRGAELVLWHQRRRANPNLPALVTK